jgi:uncharacterized protein (TIGR02147 family)
MGKGSAAGKPGKPERPEVYRYHDYREFLRDWIAFRKQSERGFSARKLSVRAGLAVGFLPMVLGGKYALTPRALQKLIPVLGLARAEQNYFENLVHLSTSETPEARLAALSQMKNFAGYRRKHPEETEAFGYWSRWFHPVIREMVYLPGFRPDPDWIQPRLKTKVTRAKIASALEFLIQNGYIQVGAEGALIPPKERLKCVGAVYKTVLTHFHQEMFKLAAESIESVPAAERNIVGHTLAIDSSKFEGIRKILDEAIEKVQEFAGSPSSDSVYHLELAFFPLARRKE